MKCLNIGTPEWNRAFSYWAICFADTEGERIHVSIHTPFYDPRFLDLSPHAFVEACRKTNKLRVFWGKGRFFSGFLSFATENRDRIIRVDIDHGV
tara:strand:- start:4899 stop:5183 length:285 start_codon:yes stop_codon:yes gene_type:complete